MEPTLPGQAQEISFLGQQQKAELRSIELIPYNSYFQTIVNLQFYNYIVNLQINRKVRVMRLKLYYKSFFSFGVPPHLRKK